MSSEQYNTLSETVIASEGQSKLDECCKALLSEKQFLAWILQSCEDAYKDKSIDEIINCIEGEPVVGKIPVGEGLENKQNTDKIKGMSTEDASKYEGTVRYDIRFRSRLFDGKESELIVNVEAQNDFSPGYRLVTRGIYYTSRMISSQKGSEFEGSEYQKIKKVHSIWICINPNEQWRGKINTYQIQEKHLLGKVSEDKNEYDKIQITMICLDKWSDNREKNVISLLNIALDDEASADEKLKLLKEDFHIRTTEKLKTEAKNMCDYSKSIMQKGIEKGTLNEKIATAKRMIATGVEDTVIKVATELDDETIKRLREEN